MDHTVHVFQAAFQPSATLLQCSPASKGGEAPPSSVLKIIWTAVFPYDKELESQILHFSPSSPQMCQTSGGMQSQNAMSFSCHCVIITHWYKIDPELLLSGLQLGKNPKELSKFRSCSSNKLGGFLLQGLVRCCCPSMPFKESERHAAMQWGRNSSEDSNTGAQKFSYCQASSFLPVL